MDQLRGGIDVASKDITGNQKAVTAEQIAAWNPDIIIVGTAPNSDNVKQFCPTRNGAALMP